MDYSQALKLTGSNRKARELLRSIYAERREKEVHTADAAYKRREDKILQRKVDIRIATDGPFSVQNHIEKYQKRLIPLESLSSEIDQLIRKSYSTRCIVIQWKGLTKVPRAVETSLTHQFNMVHTLRLSGNKLSKLPNWTRRHFSSLTELNVSNNRLECLPDTLGQLTTLKLAVFDFNQLSELPDSFCALSRLQELRISGNGLERLPALFGKLTSLKTLLLESNHLDVLPKSFSKLIKLRTFDLSRNILRSLAFISPPEKIDEHGEVTKEELDKNWEIIEHNDELIYYCRNTAETRRFIEPVASSVDPWDEKLSTEVEIMTSASQDKASIPKLKMQSLSNDNKSRDGKIITRRKQALARQNIAQWTCELDYNTGKMSYRNNVLRTDHDSMPKELDKLGQLEHIEQLFLKGNQLLSIPASISKLVRLKYLSLESNRLSEIRFEISGLTKLETLELGDNYISKVPQHIANLVNLKTLMLHRNIIDTVAPDIGKLTQLKSIWLNDNRLETIPDTMRNLINIKEFKIADNPLQEPCSKLLSCKDMESLLWELRQIYLLRKHGPLPKMEGVRHGIIEERRETKSTFNKDEEDMIEKARISGVLALHWRNLREIPSGVLQLKNLEELRLVGNLIGSLPADLGLLGRLRVLELRNNKLQELTPNIGLLKSLQMLFLEDNELKTLPEQIGELLNLEMLVLSGNKLCSLPRSLEKLVRLNTLKADINRLRALPEEIGYMKQLHTLFLSRNKISEIPETFEKLETLEVLLLDQNEITRIPESLCSLKRLRELYLSHNHIKEIPEAMGKSPIAKCLEILWLYSNQIIQLNFSFCHMTALKVLRLDNNGMRSPPESFAAKEISQVLKYCKIRRDRIHEIEERLSLGSFEYNSDSLTPKTENLIIGGSGFLTQKDIKIFEENVDHFLNADFYNYDKTGKELVDAFIALRAERLTTFQRLVLIQFLLVLEQLREDETICSRVYFNPKVYRAWKKRSVPVPCYALRLEALFEDQENPKQEAINKVLERRFKQTKLTDDDTYDHNVKEIHFRHIVFEGEEFKLNQEILEDALEKFRDPSNCQIATANDLVRFQRYRLKDKFSELHKMKQKSKLQMKQLLEKRELDKESENSESTDGESSTGDFSVEENRENQSQTNENGDEEAAEDKENLAAHNYEGKLKDPFVHRAATISTLIYTPEELQREKDEAIYFKATLKEERENLKAYLLTKEAEEKVKLEIKRRKNYAKSRIARLKVEIEECKREFKEAKIHLKDIKSRIKLFNQNEPRHVHGFSSQEDADIADEEANQRLKDADMDLKETVQTVKDLRFKLKKQKLPVWIRECHDSMKKKIIERAKKDVIQKGRNYAYKKGLRRPWDGKCGIIYERWKNLQDALERERLEAEEEVESSDEYDSSEDESGLSDGSGKAESLEEEDESDDETESEDDKEENENETVSVKKYSWSEDDLGMSSSEDEFPVYDDEAKKADVVPAGDGSSSESTFVSSGSEETSSDEDYSSSEESQN